MSRQEARMSRSPASTGRRSFTLSLRPDLIRSIAFCWIAVASLVYLVDLMGQTKAGLGDGEGRPLGDDFVNYWSAAQLAWRGRAAEIYDWHAFHGFQESVIGSTIGFFHYSYPPVLFILTLPLAAIPYVPALAAWLVAGWYAFYRALRLVIPDGALLLALATPAVFINAVNGQNGVWTAALFGGGLALLERRPVVAGVLFGMLVYKPQLAVLIPVALLAGRQWRALSTAAATSVALVTLSAAVFGVEIWNDYLRNVALLRQAVLEDGTGVWHRMVSVFVFVRRLGGGVETAYAVQAAAALAAAAAVAVVWFRGAPAPARCALLVLGTWLATPYLQDYDLVLGAFVAAWLTDRNGEAMDLRNPAVLGAVLVLALPVLSVSLAKATGLSWGPVFLVPAFVIAARMAPGAFALPART